MKKNEEHIAVIQARMGSTRFSGKTMASIAGRPLLWHIIERLKRSVYLTKIVLATSRAKENDILEDLSSKQKIFVIRGDEHDVLSRFELAFKVYKPSTITRICGDCPLVEPSFIDRSIEQIVQQDVDYLQADCSEVIHQGIETISNFCFKRNLSFKNSTSLISSSFLPTIYCFLKHFDILIDLSINDKSFIFKFHFFNPFNLEFLPPAKIPILA